MRTRTIVLGGFAALATALVACSDLGDERQHAPTAPTAGPAFRVTEGGRIRVHGDGLARAHTAGGVASHLIPSFIATGTFRGGVARDEGAGTPMGVIGIAANTRARLPGAGLLVRKWLADNGDRVALVLEFDADGAPMRGTRLYVNGALRMAASFQWTPGPSGFSLRSSSRRIYRDGRATSEVSAAAGAAEPLAARAFAPDALAHFAAGLAGLIAPTDAEAQIFSGPCRTQWLQYIAATAVLAAATIAVEKQPTNPLAWAAMIAASASATVAEMALWICEQNAWERENPIGGGGGGGGGFSPCVTDPWISSCEAPLPFIQ